MFCGPDLGVFFVVYTGVMPVCEADRFGASLEVLLRGVLGVLCDIWIGVIPLGSSEGVVL